MAYAIPSIQVVSGLIVAYLTFVFGSATTDPSVFVMVGMLFCIGLYVAVYGLFSGVEAAIAAAVDRSTIGSDAGADVPVDTDADTDG